MEGAKEEDLIPSWTIKNDGHELASWSKYAAIRHSLNQITHHRAQLGGVIEYGSIYIMRQKNFLWKTGVNLIYHLMNQCK